MRCSKPGGRRNNRDSVVQVGASDSFFRGHACGKECEGFAAGYRQAERVGLTRIEGCLEMQPAHRHGCRAYYDELTDHSGESTDPRQ